MALGSTDCGHSPLNHITRRASRNGPFIYQLKHVALQFCDRTLGLRAQNSLSPRYLGFWTQLFEGRISRPQTKELLINVSTWPFLVMLIQGRLVMTYMAYLLVLESEILFQEMTFKVDVESHLAVSLFGSWKKTVRSCLIHPTLQKQNKPETSLHFSGGIFKEMLWNYLAWRIIPFSKWYSKYWLITMISKSPKPGKRENPTKNCMFGMLKNMFPRCSRTMRVTRLRKSSASWAVFDLGPESWKYMVEIFHFYLWMQTTSNCL